MFAKGLFVLPVAGLSADGLFIAGLPVPGFSVLPVDELFVPGFSVLPVDGSSVPGLLLSSDTSSFASAASSIVPYTDDLDQPMPVSSFQLKVPILAPEASASFIWNSRPILSPFFGFMSVHLKAASITYPSPVTFAADCTFSSRHFFPLKECSFS